MKSQIREQVYRTVDVTAGYVIVEQDGIRPLRLEQWATKLISGFQSRIRTRRHAPRAPLKSAMPNQMFERTDYNGFRLMIWRQGRDQKQGWPSPFISRLNRRAKP